MSYTRDWSVATSLDPWVAKYGQDYTFDSGLEFNGNNTVITKGNATYASGTTTIYFSVNGSGLPQSSQRFGVSLWNEGDNLFMAEARSQVKNGDVNWWWGFCTINQLTGQRTPVGTFNYDNGYSLVEDGTMEVWNSGGQWHNKLTYESVDMGTCVSGTAVYAPQLESCVIGHYGYVVAGEPHVTITEGTYSPTVTTDPIGRYFWYDGYYNNGSSQGIKDLTSLVLKTSPIQQYLYIPTVQGAFSSQVTVTLKNDSDQWGSFTGHATSGTSYNPTGVFYIRDAEVASGQETLFAGFLDYKTIAVDALNQTVTITLNSVLSGLVDKSIAPSSTTNETWAGAGYDFGVIHPLILGSIVSIERDSNANSGTITYSSGWEFKGGENLTVNQTDFTSEFSSFKVGEFLGVEGQQGSFTVTKIPDWISAGDQLYGNKPYPEEVGDSSINGRTFYESFMQLPLSIYNENYLNAWGGASLNWNIASSAMETALESVIISPSKYLYGDETFIEVLDDFLLAVGGGGFSAYDGNSVNIFVPSPTFLLQDASGTLNYETDCYGAFTASKESPVRSAFVEYAYDDNSKKYLENVRVDTDFSYGDDKKISTWLINHNEDARNLAFFTSAYFSSGATVVIKTDTSHWAKQKPGNILEINNLPSSFETNGTKFLVTSRTFDPSDKLVTSLVQEVTLEASDFFRVAIHNIGESTGVL